MNIQEFITDVKRNWEKTQRNRPASEVLLGAMREIDWPVEFTQAGYYSHQINTIKHWNDIHAWCQEHFGQDHYAWTGSVFWFERHEDAVFFKLRWA